jgi:hypothetical protein
MPPVATSLEHIQRLAAEALQQSGRRAFFAGTSKPLDAPGGVGKILVLSASKDAGGITLTENAAAYTTPVLETRPSHEKVGLNFVHYATVVKVKAEDVVHESYYPAPGDHLRPGLSYQQKGQTIDRYLRITDEISELMRQGEEEHLADAKLAFDLTYGLIADKINSMVGRRFGPAPNPTAADQLAQTELNRMLPVQLGVTPANWVKVLDRLLKMTIKRDNEGWHTLSPRYPTVEGNREISELQKTSTTRIGTVPSSDVVKY